MRACSQLLQLNPACHIVERHSTNRTQMNTRKKVQLAIYAPGKADIKFGTCLEEMMAIASAAIPSAYRWCQLTIAVLSGVMLLSSLIQLLALRYRQRPKHDVGMPAVLVSSVFLFSLQADPYSADSIFPGWLSAALSVNSLVVQGFALQEYVHGVMSVLYARTYLGHELPKWWDGVMAMPSILFTLTANTFVILYAVAESTALDTALWMIVSCFIGLFSVICTVTICRLLVVLSHKPVAQSSLRAFFVSLCLPKESVARRARNLMFAVNIVVWPLSSLLMLTLILDPNASRFDAAQFNWAALLPSAASTGLNVVLLNAFWKRNAW